jgi:hypothetical protein
MKIVDVAPLFFLAVGCASQRFATEPAAASTTVVAPAGSPTPPAPQLVVPAATPSAITVTNGQQVLVKALGKGVQIYACNPTQSGPGAYEWALKAPEADLFDEKGQKIGKHYGGPTWESIDGSKVVGKLRSKVDAPDATAIPWLLLDAKSTEGEGAFARVKNIQRVATSGGKAPASGCDAAHSSAETRVDYSATYYMYGP